jgi:hypothetical protein
MLVFLLILLAPLAHAQITWGSGESASSYYGSTVTVTITVNAGQAVFAVASYRASGSGCGSATISVSTNGSGGNTSFTQDGALHSRDYVCTGYYYLLDAASATTVTATSNAVREYLSMTVGTANGVATSGALDVSTTTSRTFDYSGPITSAAFSTTTANQIIVCLTGGYWTGTWTADNIGSSSGTLFHSPISNFTAGEYRIVSDTQSSITGTMTTSGTSSNNIGCMSFKESTGGGGGGGSAYRRRVIVQ